MPDQSTDTPAALGPVLTCSPGKAGNRLLFPYSLQNPGPVDLYVMDALPTVDPESRRAVADEHVAFVICGDDGEVTLGKFIAPLPTDRRIALPIIPLARLLTVGSVLEGQVEIQLPLAETSPYFADLTLRQYEIVEVRRVNVVIGYWLAGRDSLVATPPDYSPERLVITTRDTVKSAKQVSQAFPTNGLQVFRRTDAFPRPRGSQ